MKNWLFIGMLLCFAALPFELPVAEALHGILWTSIGDWYLLFLCSTWMIIVSACFVASRIGRISHGWQQFTSYSVLYLAIGLLAIVSTAFAAPDNLQLSFQQFVFGYAAPVLLCLALFCMDKEEQRRAWMAFYSGWCLFLIGSLIFLFVSWRVAVDQSSFFSGLTIGQKLFAWRYTFGEPWNTYSAYIGNANKESNYIIIFLLFSPLLLGNRIHERGPTRSIYLLFWSLSVFTLFILFSRAALFLLPVVVLTTGLWKTLRRFARWAIVTAVGLTAVISYSSYSAVLAYLFTATFVDDVSGGVLGTFTDRFQQWNELAAYFVRHQEKLLFGIGTGGYGVQFFNSAERGTHNMFLDTLTESGLLGLVLLVILVVWLVLHSLNFLQHKTIHVIGLVGIASLVALMFREHSVSYLYVTSLGGVCFTTIFYLLASSRKTSP